MSKEKEILFVVEALSNEKGVEKEIIFQALESALASATQKPNHYEMDIQVDINRNTGEYKTYRRWTVVADNDYEALIEEEKNISLKQALEQDPNLEVGSVIVKEIPSIDFGRIAAQNARQVLLQKIREAERKRIVESFIDKLGQLISGTVKRVTRDFIFVDLGNNAEGAIPRDQLIPKEVFRAGDRIRAYLLSVKPEAKAQQILLSRTDARMLAELFRIEVPEIGEGVIEIMDVAREPGQRAKVAVKTNDGRIDPIGACIGMRGSRVQAVSNELGNERIDIILWNANPAQYVINSLAPAEVVSIVVDEENHSMDIAIPEEQLSQAIGRSGQNIRLASELTGWTLNVMSEKEAVEKNEAESHDLQAMFMEKLDVDEDLAIILVREGFTSIEEIAYVPTSELLAVDEFDEDIVKALRERAKDILLAEAISEGTSATSSHSEHLIHLKGMTEEIAKLLAEHDIHTQEDLAEQAVDDLTDLGIQQDKAAELIMAAREPWFANSKN